MSRELLLAALAAMLVVVAIAAAAPSLRRGNRPPAWLARWGDPLAAGVFLGAGLIHLLPDATAAFLASGRHYPWSFAICGAAALALAMLEYGSSVRSGTRGSALVAAAALAVHSLLAGAALGATSRPAALLALFLALVAHKGAASFSLSRLLAESGLPRAIVLAAQGAFVVALPLGVLAGAAITHRRHDWPLALPVALSLGAGTFLYFGTMHHAQHRSVDDRRWWLAAIGFVGMALIAVMA